MSDPAYSDNVFQAIKVSVSNAQPGQKIAIRLSPNGTEVAWSTGQDFMNIDGISLTSQSGALPLMQFSVNTGELVFVTSPGGGGGGTLSLALGAYLVAGAGIDSFYLASASDPGVEVTAAIGYSTPQAVNTGLTLFAWNPI